MKTKGLVVCAIIVFAIGALSTPSRAQPAKGVSVTVVPFEAVGKVDKTVSQVVSAELESQISTAVQKTISQGSLQADAFIQSCGMEVCEKKTTHRVRGSVAALGSQYIVRARLETTDGGKIMFDGNRKLPQNDDSLLAAVEDLARDIVECLNGMNCDDEAGAASRNGGPTPTTALPEPSMKPDIPPPVASTKTTRPLPVPGGDWKPDKYEIREESGMMFVPAGNFLFGDDKRLIDLPAFRIDKTEVTVAAYEKCVKTGKCSEPRTDEGCTYGGWFKSDYAVNCVSWSDAKAFCEWSGKRLPTDQEWEKGARGTDGRPYPWGEQEPNCERAVISQGGRGCGKGSIWPVCSKPDGNSPYGLCDMFGNAFEWTADWYDSSQKYRVVRGVSWDFDGIKGLHADYRHLSSPQYRRTGYGIRCAQDVKKP